MFAHCLRRHETTALAVVVLLLTAIAASAPAHALGNPNPRVVPNKGHNYADLSIDWWLWALSFADAEFPPFNTGGPVDISAHQSGHVWFLAGANNGLTTPRTGVVPSGTTLFFPLANLINDYPCPFPFEPDPGETLEHFLQRTGNDFLPDLTDLFAEIDGVSLTDLSVYRATSPLFTFTGDPALTHWDPCITGSAQDGVSVGYWFLLPPLPPGQHTLRFGAPSWGQDITYILTVTPGH